MIKKLISPKSPCGQPGCRAAAMKGSDPPRCYFHCESTLAARQQAAAKGRLVQQAKRRGEGNAILDELAASIEEYDRKEAEYRARQEAIRQEILARGWSLSHRVLDGIRVKCDLPTCWCHQTLSTAMEPVVTLELKGINHEEVQK